MLFNPLKALGIHSSNVPLYIKPTDNNDFYLFSAVGCYFLVYRFSNLALIGTSDRIEENILSIAGHKNLVFCGCESKVYGLVRAKHVVRSYEFNGTKNWKLMTVLSGEPGYLCAINGDNGLVVWDINTAEVKLSMSFPHGEFDVVAMIQPMEYTDKVLVASTGGKMQLINYMYNKLIYAFNLNCRITTLQQTPNNDTIAVGCADGTVLLHNLLYDKTIIKVSQDMGLISSISFRTDIAGELIMLTGTDNGHVAMWNLEKSRAVGQARDCHHGSVSSLFCVPGKPLLLSSGPDNSIKVWNYDRPDGTPVLLRHRAGHWLPPTAIRYWPADSVTASELLSAGGDGCLRVFSTYDERHSFSMGRAYLPHHGGNSEPKASKEQYSLPPAVHVAASSARDGFWDSVALCHRGHRAVTTWTHSKRCRGAHYLDSKTFRHREFAFKRVAAERCAISACGNFVVVGYSSGHVAKFNIQSGIERGQAAAHSDGVVGVEIGQTGARAAVVSAGGSELAMWDLDSLHELGRLAVDAPLHQLALHPHRDMVAAATTDGHVRLVQLDSFVVFADLVASVHGKPVSAITFCHSVELVVIADRHFIKTFDYINNKLVDCFKVRHAVTQLAMAPNDSYLITTHEGDLGLYLWALKLHQVDMKLASLPIDYEPICALTEAKMLCDDDNEEDIDDVEGQEESETTNGTKHELLTADGNVAKTEAEGMLQLSGLASSYFSSMLNIENVRIRNENAAKGMVSSSAFFLPQIAETLDGLKWVDGNETNTDAADGSDRLQQMRKIEKKRKIDDMRNSDIQSVDQLAAMLATAVTDADYDKVMEFVKTLSPTTVDHEIEKLDPVYHLDDEQQSGYQQMHSFLRLLINQLNRSRCVELCQMYLACLLQHSSACLSDPASGDQQSGIDGLLEHEEATRDASDAANSGRLQALSLANEAVAVMRRGHQAVAGSLSQIIEMAQFANNNNIY